MDPAHIEAFRQHFRGEVILPGDNDYETASTTFLYKGHPSVVLRPKRAKDVAAAITFAREHSLKLSVRSGGHDNAGHSTNDGGAVIDLQHLNKIEVLDQKKGVVRIGGGAKWGDIAKALHEHGLAITSGDTASVGIGGLALAGGIGWMVCKYGLTIDSIQEVELVTADGKIVHANSHERTDLFWAVRGGGGNFGVATAFTITAHPAQDVYAGRIGFTVEDPAAFLKGWRDIMRRATKDLTTTVSLIPPMFGNPPACMLLFCWANNNKASAEAALAPFRELAPVSHEDWKVKPYYEVLEHPKPPAGVRIFVNNAFLDDPSDSCLDHIAASYKANDLVLQIRYIGGALNKIAPDATAFAHRGSEMLVVSPRFVSPNATAEEIKAALKPWRAIAEFGKGAYTNFFSSSGKREVEIAYPPATYARLAKVKAHYDPQNIFNQNYNIPPAV